MSAELIFIPPWDRLWAPALGWYSLCALFQDCALLQRKKPAFLHHKCRKTRWCFQRARHGAQKACSSHHGGFNARSNGVNFDRRSFFWVHANQWLITTEDWIILASKLASLLMKCTASQRRLFKQQPCGSQADKLSHTGFDGFHVVDFPLPAELSEMHSHFKKCWNKALFSKQATGVFPLACCLVLFCF